MARLKKEDREDLIGSLGEAFHTAFRKGTDANGAMKVHRAITDLEDGGYREVLETVVAWMSDGRGMYHIVPKSKFKVLPK